MINYSKTRRDIAHWMRQDYHGDARFTTMFDLYALPQDFPAHGDARHEMDPYRRVGKLEQAIAEDIDDPRLIPYIQLHEFEALIFTNPQELEWVFIEQQSEIAELVRIRNSFAHPEEIDEGEDTAPSKRIIRALPEYEGLKATAGPLVAAKIGLEEIRRQCVHFHEWLLRLEELDQSGQSIAHDG